MSPLEAPGEVLIDGRPVSLEDLPIFPIQDEGSNPPPKPGYPVPTLNGTPNPRGGRGRSVEVELSRRFQHISGFCLRTRFGLFSTKSFEFVSKESTESVAYYF